MSLCLASSASYLHFHAAAKLEESTEVVLVCEDMTEKKWQGVGHMYTLALTFISITGLHVGVVSHVNRHRNSRLTT